MRRLTLPNGEIISYIDKLTALDIYDEIYVKNEYLRHDIQLSDNDVVFDIGANIGLFSRYIATQAKNLQIFTFEPVSVIFDVLEENVKNLPVKIKNYNVGLAEREEITEIHYYPKVSADSAIVEFDWDLKVNQFLQNYKQFVVDFIPGAKFVPKFMRKSVIKRGLKCMYKSELLPCKLRTISDIIQENNVEIINLMKIDAENYEFQVLAGIEQQDWDKIQQLSMEVHEHIEGGKNLLDKLADMLEEKGFHVVKEKDSRFSLMGVYML
ncbi:MAG: FkbM family methyltransferase, partial [Candidatus Hermodarchaeota archaeon]